MVPEAESQSVSYTPPEPDIEVWLRVLGYSTATPGLVVTAATDMMGYFVTHEATGSHLGWCFPTVEAARAFAGGLRGTAPWDHAGDELSGSLRGLQPLIDS